MQYEQYMEIDDRWDHDDDDDDYNDDYGDDDNDDDDDDDDHYDDDDHGDSSNTSDFELNRLKYYVWADHSILFVTYRSIHDDDDADEKEAI
jgi:hypothetical protein